MLPKTSGGYNSDRSWLWKFFYMYDCREDPLRAFIQKPLTLNKNTPELSVLG